jgi:hypothetical protein
LSYVCFYYLGVDPSAVHIRDTELTHKNRVTLKSEQKDFTVNIVGDEKSIKFLRIDISSCTNEELSDHDLKIIHKIKEYALALLRLSYDRDVAYLAFPFWTFRKEGDTSRFDIGISLAYNRPPVNYVNLINALSSMDVSPKQIKLMGDAVNPTVPLRFRYLSTFTIIEDYFQTSKGLNDQALDAFLKQQNSTLDRGGLIGMRDKCAHIKYKKHAGYIELNYAEAILIESKLEEICRLAAIITEVLNEGKLKLWHT